MRPHTWAWLLLPMTLAGGFGLGMWAGPDALKRILGPGTEAAGTGTATADDQPRVSALGRLRPAGGVLSVMGPTGDRVKKLLVAEGNDVEPDQPLVLLASAADREAELKLARQQLAEAEGTRKAIEHSRLVRLADIDEQLESLRTTQKVEDEAHQVKIALIREQLAGVRSRQRRLASLDPGVVRVSAQEREQMDLAVSQARRELEAAETARKASRTKYELQGKTIEAQRKVAEAEFDLALARVPLESLRQAEQLARRRVEQSTLKSSAKGRVLRVVTREGDAITMQPILELDAGDGLVTVAEVYAPDADKITRWLEAGQGVEAEVESPAFKDVPLRGAVSSRDAVGRVVARNNVPGFSPRSEGDRRVVEVRVDLETSAASLARRFIGLEVNVKFRPRPAQTAQREAPRASSGQPDVRQR